MRQKKNAIADTVDNPQELEVQEAIMKGDETTTH